MARGQKAWLVLWNWAGPHAAVEDRLAAILRPRLSQRLVGEIVECLYALHAYTPSELAFWAKRPNEIPYKALWEGAACHCGNHPYLTAQYVHDLRIHEDSETELETISYVLPPRYGYNHDTMEREVLRPALPRSFTRTITGPLSVREADHPDLPGSA